MTSSAWLESLADLVCISVEAYSAMGPFGFRYRQDDEDWELIVYPTPVELMGGSEDGALVHSGFSLDIQFLLSRFEQVTAVQWLTHDFGVSEPEGPQLSIEGIYQGHNIWLRVLAEPPPNEPPGLQLKVLP
ncbi:MAG: hypothetical protein AAGC93_26000 [Cyanobacteria bacterium P01_F01_bin.53]